MKHSPVVPPPGGVSADRTPGNLRDLKSNPYLWWKYCKIVIRGVIFTYSAAWTKKALAIRSDFHGNLMLPPTSIGSVYPHYIVDPLPMQSTIYPSTPYQFQPYPLTLPTTQPHPLPHPLPYLSKQFHMDFWHTINSPGALDGDIGTWVTGGGWPECTDCTRTE